MKRIKRESFSSDLYYYEASDFHLIDERHKGYIGAGNFSHVRRCYHDELGEVAIKLFKLSTMESSDEPQHDTPEKCILREANTLSRLRHNNIVIFLGVVESPTDIGLVMEYVAAGNLQNLPFNHNIKIPWLVDLVILQQLSSALAYLHNYSSTTKICHGDVKPQNVLIATDLTVKLADFGGASVLDGGDDPSSWLKVPPSTQHTEFYASNEVLDNPAIKRTPSMDMYSFGVVVMVTILRKELLQHTRFLSQKLIMEKIENVRCAKGETTDNEIFTFMENLIVTCRVDEPEGRKTSTAVNGEIEKFLKGISPAIIHKQVLKVASQLPMSPTPHICGSITCIKLSSLSEPLCNLSAGIERGQLSSIGKDLDHSKLERFKAQVEPLIFTEELFKHIKEAKKHMGQEDERVQCKALLTRLNLSSHLYDLPKFVKEILELSKDVESSDLSINFLKQALKFAQKLDSPKLKLEALHQCTHYGLQLLDRLIVDSRQETATLTVLPYIVKVCEIVEDVPTDDSRDKALHIALCLSNKAFCLCQLEKYEESITIGTEVSKALQGSYSTIEIDSMWFMSMVYHTLGFSYFKRNEFDNAESFAEKAMKVAETSADWPDETTKQRQIVENQKLLDQIKAAN